MPTNRNLEKFTAMIAPSRTAAAAPLVVAAAFALVSVLKVGVDAFSPSSQKHVRGRTSNPSITPHSSSLSALLTSGDTTVPSTIDFGLAGPSGLSGVSNIIAVSSCKGGVGKSTTSVNLVYSLRSLGYKVGIFDADLFGPSLPTMITPENDDVIFVGRQIAPLVNNDVKLMSFGYVNDGSAIMRGPMITQLLDQFLSMVHWGELDYLILDMPPGTGDVQLTLTQRLNITAAVIVTTPQELSYVDVARGIEMFDTVNVPCVAVVENMAYYELDQTTAATEGSVKNGLDTDALKKAFVEELTSNGITAENGKDIAEVADKLVALVQDQIQLSDNNNNKSIGGAKMRIFGEGHTDRLAKQYGIENIFSVPLLDRIASNGDSGVPFVLDNPDAKEAVIYKQLAESVVSEVGKIAEMAISRPSIRYDEEEHIITVMDIVKPEGDESSSNGDKESSIDVAKIPPAELRRDCRCAACVEELTGKQLLNAADVPDSVRPLGDMETYGNYAISVDWSDGHKSLYPYTQIRSLVQDLKDGKTVAEMKKEKMAG